MLAFGGLEPVEVIGGFDNALFDATAGFFRAGFLVPDLVALGFAGFERFMIGEEGGDFGVRGAMVGFEGEEGMGSGEVDFPGDLFLADHRGKCDEKYLAEVVALGLAMAGIGEAFQMLPD